MIDKELTMEETISMANLKGWSEKKVLADVEERIKQGENINQQVDRASTPIMTAAAQGYLSIVKRLVEAGADLTIKNRWKDDVLRCAKLSGNKELIAFVKAAVSGAPASAEPAAMYFRPKKGTEAEYTFYPSKQFKQQHDSDQNDVGFFLNDAEVLKLEPVKPATAKAGTLTVFIEEGKVTLHVEAWETLDERALKPLLSKSKVGVHDISSITDEYLSD